MSRRVAKYYFWLAKIDPRHPEERARDYDPLAWILKTIMAPLANERFGQRGQDSAFADAISDAAALHALDRTGSCQMHFTARKQEHNLLTTAYRRAHSGARKLAAQQVAEAEELARQRAGLDAGWEPWHFALRDLLHLTSRFWTFIRLFLPRCSHCWKGPLARVIWGPERQQGALTPHVHSLEQLDQELESALTLLYQPDRQDDPVIRFLRQLEASAIRDPLSYESWGPRRAWLLHVKQAFPEPFLEVSAYPQLLGSLTRLRALLHQPGRDVLGLAWSEFGKEMVERRGGSASQAPAHIIAVLDTLYNGGHHALERRPGDVLASILPMPLTTADPPSRPAPSAGFNPTRLQLVAHLRRSVAAGTPEDSVLAHALTSPAASFDSLRDALTPHPPQSLAADLLEEARARLGGWLESLRAQQARTRLWRHDGAPPESYELWDLARDACDENTLIQAHALVEEWIQDPAAPRLAWSELSRSVSLAIRSAVLSSCLDRLWDDMNDFFVNERGKQPPPSPSRGP